MTGSIADAIAHHQAGRLAEAESLYRQLLAREPNHVDALHYLGVLRMAQGRPAEAIELLRKVLPLAPQNALIWNSLGSVLSRAGNPPAAEFAFQNATKLKPDYAEAWYNLANLLRGLRRDEEAVQAYRRVLELEPKFAGAYENVAMLLKRLGREDLAAEAYLKWAAAEPGNPIARHMAAAHQAAQAPERADDRFVAQLFDRMAPSFDSALAALDYAAPRLIAEALSPVLSPASASLAILDLGCGTGLCGPLLRPAARRLIGVDLSAGMLAKARERGVYDELHEAELVAFLRAHPESADVIVCADTFVYFGALDAACAAAAAALKPGGSFAFTVEAEPAGSTEKFRLHGHGRYSHGAAHVRKCLTDAGFTAVKSDPAVLRKEGGADVQGYVFVASNAS